MEIDRKTLKALGAETRMDILKSLKQRRKTPSELARELKLSSPTILEHLNKLEGADLVERVETGHKWVYYTLTKKGTNLIKPRFPTQFVIILGISILLVFTFMFNFGDQETFSATTMKGSPDRGIEQASGVAAPETSMEENVTQNISNSSYVP